MPRVTVGFEDYQAGRLPPVCVLTGQPADDTLVMVTPVTTRPAGTRLGPLTAALERLVEHLRVNRTFEGLEGRLPVSAARYRLLVRRRQQLSWLVAASAVGLVASAWVAQWWSPAAALLSATLLAVAAARRAVWRRDLPRPALAPGGTRVILDGVHQRFADALDSSWRP